MKHSKAKRPVPRSRTETLLSKVMELGGGRSAAKDASYMSSDEELQARMAELARKGIVKLPRGPLPEDFWTLPRPKDPEGKVLAALLEERGSSV
jgi:hypothetical protein